MCPSMYRLRVPSASPLPPTHWLVGKERGLPTVPHSSMSLVLPPNWSQAAGTGPRRAGAGQHPISGALFLSSSCAPCRLTGPGDRPQPLLTATHAAELSHAPQAGLTLGLEGLWVNSLDVATTGGGRRDQLHGREPLGQSLVPDSSGLLVEGELPKVRHV